MPRSIILDVDTGTDDAIAIMMAALSPAIDLIACTTVWGNRPVDNTTDNTLRVLDYIGRSEIPVYKGLDKPFGPIAIPGLDSGADDHSHEPRAATGCCRVVGRVPSRPDRTGDACPGRAADKHRRRRHP
jgi:hypothetical protein